MITILATLLSTAVLAKGDSSLKDWRFFEDQTAVYAVRRKGHDGYDAVYKEAVFNDPTSCHSQVTAIFKTVDAHTLVLTEDETGGISVAEKKSGQLRISKKCDEGQGAVPTAEHKICVKESCAPAEASPIQECNIPGCSKLLLAKAGQAPRPLTAADLDRKITAYGLLVEPKKDPAAGALTLDKVAPKTQAAIHEMLAASKAQGVADFAKFAIVGADGSVKGMAATEAEARQGAAAGDQVVATAAPAAPATAKPAPAEKKLGDTLEFMSVKAKEEKVLPPTHAPDGTAMDPGLPTETHPNVTAAVANKILVVAQTKYASADKELKAAQNNRDYIQSKPGYNQKDRTRAEDRLTAAKAAFTEASAKLDTARADAVKITTPAAQ